MMKTLAFCVCVCVEVGRTGGARDTGAGITDKAVDLGSFAELTSGCLGFPIRCMNFLKNVIQTRMHGNGSTMAH